MTQIEAPVRPATPGASDTLVNPAPDVAPAGEDRSAMLPIAAVAAAGALLSACGGGEEPPLPEIQTDGFLFPSAASDDEAARFLQQAQFSSTPGEIANLRSGSYANWLARQFGSAVGPTGWSWLDAQKYDSVDFRSDTRPADYMIWSQLMSGSDAMRRRMALALSEFFVASMQAADFTWRSYAFAHYWDTLVRNAFGNFRQLLEDVTLHPAMGWFLNTKGNQKENPATGRVPDENYSREVMQLFTLGLYRLNPDGTVQTDGSGKPLETYTESDVTQLARVFTGYDFDTSDGKRLPLTGGGTVISRDFARKPMALNPDRHSLLEAQFLGATVPAGTPGEEALQIALDTLFNHPNVGPFFARQMIQRLVTSDPSPAYVARVAARFDDNGWGVRGDLSAVWAAILLDDEARGPQGLSDIGFGKVREPMLRLVQWARSFGASSADGTWKIPELGNPATRLGQSPLRAPSVFNFFRPGYVPPNTALSDAKATAPEFQLVNETTVGAYLNYMQGVIQNGVIADVKATYSRELALVTDARALVSHLSRVLCAGQLSATTQDLMVTALEATPVTSTSTDATKRNRVMGAVLMVMASPEYLVQK